MNRVNQCVTLRFRLLAAKASLGVIEVSGLRGKERKCTS
jgi:hypothetical protein